MVGKSDYRQKPAHSNQSQFQVSFKDGINSEPIHKRKYQAFSFHAPLLANSNLVFYKIYASLRTAILSKNIAIKLVKKIVSIRLLSTEKLS